MPPTGDVEENANGTYTISLSTTSAPVNGLSSNMSNNIGADNTTIFSGPLPTYVADSTLTFSLATPFVYDPSQGNLLLNITFSGVTNDTYADYVAQNDDFGTLSSRMVNGLSTGRSGYGLVTTFNIVPEPSTLGLAMIGLVTGAGMFRRHHGARA
jgi:PEP-CTERM motif